MPARNQTLPMQNDLASPTRWLRTATIYGVVVRNIGNGDFRSVIARLDDWAALGIDALWFAPITQTPPGCFGYEVTNYVDVRPEYGTLADFRQLVDAVHARNMRVLLDVVPNHTSSEHPYYQNVLGEGESSPWYDFYDRDAHGTVTHYFDWTHLPNLNFNNPDVWRFIIDTALFWLREMDVDGFRIDAAWGITQRRPDFWPAFIAECKQVKPDAVFIAEASARDPFYASNGFNAAYDWTGNLGEWAWHEVFSGETPIPAAIVTALTASASKPEPDCLRFLNNNDTGVRFITTHGVDMYRVASAMLLTLPGVPCLFTGDEVGAEFEPYRDPGSIGWSDSHHLRSHFHNVIRLRKELPAFAGGIWHSIEIEPATDALAYALGEGGDTVLVLLNFSEHPVTITINTRSFETMFPNLAALHDHSSGTLVAVPHGSTREIAMPAWGVRILTAGSPA